VDNPYLFDGCKLLWHLDRVNNHYRNSWKIYPLHIDIGATKRCNAKCIYCVTGDTPITTPLGTKPIKDVKVGDTVIGFDEIGNIHKQRRLKYTTVTDIHKRMAITNVVHFTNGETLEITPDHQVLVKHRGWKDAGKLTNNNDVHYIGKQIPIQLIDRDYKIGYVKGIIDGDGTFNISPRYSTYHMRLDMIDIEALDRAYQYLIDIGFIVSYKRSKHKLYVIGKEHTHLLKKFISYKDLLLGQSQSFYRGYLGGIFDAEGSISGNNLRISNSDTSVLHMITLSLNKLHIPNTLEDYGKSVKVVRVTKGYENRIRFMQVTTPAITRKFEKAFDCKIEGVLRVNFVSIGRVTEVYDLTTESHTFIAKGLCVHNCYGIHQKMSMDVIPRDILIKLFIDAPYLGVKSLTLTGDGEPTLNPAVYDACIEGKKWGLDIGFATNGIFLDETKLRILLSTCTWLRFNLSAVDSGGYKTIHGVPQWERVQAAIRSAIYIKKTKGYKCTIGLQMVFIPDCLEQVIPEAKWAVREGVDYFVIKQFSDPGCKGMSHFNLNWYDNKRVLEVLKQAQKLSNDKTKIVPKWGMIASKGRRPYDRCVDCPLIFQISGNSKCYPCGYLFNNSDYCYGDLKKNTLKEIIDSDRYWHIIKYMREDFDVHTMCAGSCRHDFTNAFIWNYLNPPEHINFI